MSNTKNKQGQSKKKTIIIVSSVLVVLIGLGAGLGVAFGGTSEKDPNVAQTGNGGTGDPAKEKPVVITPKDYWEKTAEPDLNDESKTLDVLKISKLVKTEKQLTEAYDNIVSINLDISKVDKLYLPYHLKTIVTEEKVKEILNIKTFSNDNIGYVFNKEDYNESVVINSIGKLGGFKRQKLVEINLPESIDKIPSQAFSGNNIKKVNWSELTKLESIGDGVFNGNELTGDLDLSGLTSLTSIGSKAFIRNNINREVILPPNIVTIGERCFNSITYTQNKIKGTLKLPKSLKSIGPNAFFSNEIEVLDWSEADSLEYIGHYAFSFNKLKTLQFSATIPSKLKEMEEGAFSSNLGLNEGKEMFISDFTLPSSLQTIGPKVFKAKDGITITISSNATGISADSFEGTPTIKPSS